MVRVIYIRESPYAAAPNVAPADNTISLAFVESPRAAASEQLVAPVMNVEEMTRREATLALFGAVFRGIEASRAYMHLRCVCVWCATLNREINLVGLPPKDPPVFRGSAAARAR